MSSRCQVYCPSVDGDICWLLMGELTNSLEKDKHRHCRSFNISLSVCAQGRLTSFVRRNRGGVDLSPSVYRVIVTAKQSGSLSAWLKNPTTVSHRLRVTRQHMKAGNTEMVKLKGRSFISYPFFFPTICLTCNNKTENKFDEAHHNSWHETNMWAKRGVYATMLPQTAPVFSFNNDYLLSFVPS